MIAAIFTTFLFALSAVSGQRIAIRLGAGRGNLFRLGLAMVTLAAVTLTFSLATLTPHGFAWFFLSGLIGFGMGDIALFFAYERIGSRLTILLNLCLAPLFGATLEFFWRGVSLTWGQMGATAVILTGVAMAVLSRNPNNQARKERRGKFSHGVIAAMIAGLGQGTGAVISNHAREVANLTAPDSNGEAMLRGMSEAFQRVTAGFIVVAVVYFLWLRRTDRKNTTPLKEIPADRKQIYIWLLLASFAGPVIGVSCFQWALASVESSAIVLAIVAMTPIALMPLAAIFEHDHPTKLAILGGAIAVTGVILLQMA